MGGAGHQHGDRPPYHERGGQGCDILQVAVAINDQVSKGQVLARLDTSSLEAELAPWFRPP